MAIPAETIRTIDLGHEQMLIFEAGHQARVRVLYGATWLTEEGRRAMKSCAPATSWRCTAGAP